MSRAYDGKDFDVLRTGGKGHVKILPRRWEAPSHGVNDYANNKIQRPQEHQKTFQHRSHN